jgi:hypothetical protein
MATNTKLPFISVLSNQGLEKLSITQKLELVNYYPLGIVDQADDTLPSFYIAASESGVQEPSAPSTIVPKLFGITRMWSELSQIAHCTWVGLTDGIQRGIIVTYQDLF